MDNFHTKLVSEVLPKLKFIGGIGIYYDCNIQKRLDKHSPPTDTFDESENNFMILKDNGRFLSEDHKLVNNVELNDFFLFKVTVMSKNYNYFDPLAPKPYLFSQTLIDREGFIVHSDYFETFLKILSNRTITYLDSNDYFKLPQYLEDGIFNITSGKNGGQYFKKNGLHHLKFDETKDDGLHYFMRETRHDSFYSEHVRDNFGNTLYLNKFYRMFKMIENGKKFSAFFSNSSINDMTVFNNKK